MSSPVSVGRYGPHVNLIQNQLAVQGYSPAASEIQRSFFGPSTRLALLRWQLAHGLPATGFLDDRTSAELGAAKPSVTFLPHIPVAKPIGSRAPAIALGRDRQGKPVPFFASRKGNGLVVAKAPYSGANAAAGTLVKTASPTTSNTAINKRDLQAQAQAEGNLFKIQQGGFQAWAHGKAFATANASFHRGFDLGFEAGLSASAGANAQVGPVLATLQAGAGVDLAADVQVGFPLDLFSEAGLIAKLHLIAEAAAFAKLDVNLLPGEFTDRLTARLPNAWGTLIQIFMDEVEIGAGVFGRVAFAAEIVGEAVLVGSLLPAPDGTSSGFTFSGHYAYGYFFGAGGHVVCNFDIKDSGRLLNRLGKELTSIVQAEVKKDLDGLRQSDPALAKAISGAVPYLDLLMPLACRALFELAASLVATAVRDHPSTSPKQVVQSFLSDARAFVMHKVLEFALGELHKLLAQVAPVLQGLTDPAKQKAAIDAISTARDAATKLISASLASPDEWLDCVLSLIGAFDNFLSAGIIDNTDGYSWQTLTADIWAGAMLIRAGIEWQQSQNEQDIFSLAAPVTLPPGDSAVAAFVGAQIGKASSSLTLADIVTYLVSQLSDSEVIASVPELKKVFEWLKTILSNLSSQPNGNLFSLLLVSSDSISDAQIEAFLAQLGSGLADAVDNQLAPHIFSRLSSNPQVGEVISQIVEPTLRSVGQVILPNLANLGTDDDARRLREALSSVLLQQLTRLLMESVSVLTEVGLEQAIPAAENLAADIENQGSSHPLFNQLTMAASGAVLGEPLTATDLANLLRASEAVLKLAQPALPKILKDIEAIISLGLTEGQPQLQQIWQNIATTDNPPSQPALMQLFLDSGNLVVDVGLEIIKRLPDVLFQHYASLAKTVIATIEQAATIFFKAAEDVINQLEADIAAIERDIQKLAADVATFVANLAGALEALDQRIQGLFDGIVNQIQADGWALISPFVPGFLQGAAQDLYNGIFNDSKWLLDAPLKVLGAVANWVHDALMATVGAGGTITAQSLINSVQAQLQQTVASDLTFTISIPIPFDGNLDLGTITLPGATIISRIAASVINELQSVFGTADGVVDIGNSLSSTQQQLGTKQAMQASYSNQAQAAAAVNGMKTGQVPTIKIVSPTNSTVYADSAGLVVNITGINESFLSSGLGIPKRVRIYFNGVEYNYASDDWYQFSGVEVFSAQLMPTTRGLVARPPLNVPWTVKLNPARDGTWVVRTPKSLSVLSQVRKSTFGKGTPVHQKYKAATASLTTANAGSPIVTSGPSPVFSVRGVGITGGAAYQLGGLQVAGKYQIAPQMLPPADLLAPPGPTIVLRRGLNTLQVVVVEGDDAGAKTASALVQFYIKETTRAAN